ncbi:hypothetical protein [Halomonas alkalisoli]|uniref:hypothetical protein n=1 Tax=Halomonas alkalisoli TaxID=2907158 RepID=UPI001F479D9F|nr:hypothetical protein [Halomonas alkalisoli]MCE9682672.1 hypothetical protein [Halomonas alkalisoli]
MSASNNGFIGYPVAAMVLFACAPMISIYPIIGQRYDLGGVSAATLMSRHTALLRDHQPGDLADDAGQPSTHSLIPSGQGPAVG